MLKHSTKVTKHITIQYKKISKNIKIFTKYIKYIKILKHSPKNIKLMILGPPVSPKSLILYFLANVL